MKICIKNLEELRDFATSFLSSLLPSSQATIVALSGELGSGKTAFVKEAARFFNIKEDITSPTFVILKKFQIPNSKFITLIHIDAYRLEKDNELLKLGWEKLIKDPSNIIFIEWPQHVKNLIPQSAKKLSFTFIDERTREIEYGKVS